MNSRGWVGSLALFLVLATAASTTTAVKAAAKPSPLPGAATTAIGVPTQVRDLNTDVTQADSRFSSSRIRIGDVLYFAVNEPHVGTELWRSDGTEAGTFLVKDVRPGSDGSDPRSLVELDGTLYFFAYAPEGDALWRSDGTAPGTSLVKIVAPSFSTRVPFMFSAGGKIFLSGDDEIHGSELWMSDGTAAKTSLIADLSPGTPGSAPRNFTVTRERVFFTADDSTFFEPLNREWWSMKLHGRGTSN